MSANTSLSGLLGVAFIVLKLMGYVAWPWVWVLAPFWIPLVLVVVILVLAGITASTFGYRP